MNVFILAGEVSGDEYAAQLVAAIKERAPDIHFEGMAGEATRKQGVKIKADITAYSTIGMIEPIFYLPQLYRAYRQVQASWKHEKPDLVIAIDCQGMNMPLLKKAKTYGIRTMYLIAPQEWQWGTQSGGQKVVAVVDHLLAIFKQEADFYTKLGGNVTFVGHPLLDQVSNQTQSVKTNILAKITKKGPILSVFPGSRQQEIKRVAPVLFEAAKLMKAQVPDLQVVVSVARGHFKSTLDAQLKAVGLHATLFTGEAMALIQSAKISLASSGTITLSHALMGTPCCVAYRFSSLSYWLARTFFGKRLARIRYMSLPNLLLNKMIFPEFLQENARPESIAKAGLTLYQDGIPSKEQGSLSQQLGSEGVMARAAEVVLAELKK